MNKKRFIIMVLALVMLISTLTVTTASALPNWQSLKYWIGVDCSAQRVTIYRTSDNSVVHCWKCSTGKSGTPTPKGVFYLPNKSRSSERTLWYYFSAYGCYAKWATRIKGGILFHSVTYSKKSDSSVSKSALRHLGSPASHGCVRLLPNNAKWIAQNCPAGTKVVIYSGKNDKRIKQALGTTPSNTLTGDMPDTIDVTKVTVGCSSTVYMLEGETLELNAAVEPSNATYKTLEYTSSDSSAVSVSSEGVVTANAIGTSTITVSAEGGKTAKVNVEVYDPTKPLTVQADKETVTVNMGESFSLSAVVKPDTAEDKSVTWSSSNNSVAAVDGDGNVTAGVAGSATITVKTVNGKTDTVKVNVVDPTKATAVALDKSGTVIMYAGQTLQLNTTLSPSTAISSLKWSSSKTKYAKVNGSGLVTALKVGTTVITVKTDTGKTDTVKVTVRNPKIAYGVKLDRSGTVYMGVGDKLKLNAIIEPTTAKTSLKWYSSKTKYATVGKTGWVTAKKTGTTVITVKTSNGKKAKVTIKVVTQAEMAKMATPTPAPTATPEPSPDASASPTPDAGASESPTPDTGASENPTPDTGASESPTPDAVGSESPTPDAGGSESPTPDAGGSAGQESGN